MDYADPNTVGRINAWVNDKTGGRISSILDRPLNAGDLLELVSAVSLDGNWTYRFDESQTQPGDLHLLDGSMRQVPMMRQSGKYEYFENDQTGRGAPLRGVRPVHAWRRQHVYLSAARAREL